MTVTTRADQIRARGDAPAHVNRMLELFAVARPHAFATIAKDFQGAILKWPGLTLRVLQEQESDDGNCSVAGAYLAKADPKVIGVARASPARMRFTGLHELGHHIQQTDEELMEALLARADGGRALEEYACDSFASQLLLPQVDVDMTLGMETPSAIAIRDLWRAHSASRAAACVAAVQKLTSDGHVLLVTGAGTVEFATSRGLPRLLRGSDQSRTSMVSSILSTQLDNVRGKTRFRYRDSLSGESMWFQAAWDGAGYWFVVAATERVPWESMSLPIPNERRVLGYWWTCELCGHNWESYIPKHDSCGSPVCPECERCNCRANALLERLCEVCFMIKPMSEFDEQSKTCIEH